MKFTLVLLIVAAFVGCAWSYSCTEASFAEFKTEFNKNYADAAVDAQHFNIFCDKLKMIEEHNAKFEAGLTTWSMGVNQFTDLSASDLPPWFG